MQAETYRTLFPLFEELRGARVMLRPYQESDALALFEAVAESREHLRPWQPWIANSHQTVEESRWQNPARQKLPVLCQVHLSQLHLLSFP